MSEGTRKTDSKKIEFIERAQEFVKEAKSEFFAFTENKDKAADSDPKRVMIFVCVDEDPENEGSFVATGATLGARGGVVRAFGALFEQHSIKNAAEEAIEAVNSEEEELDFIEALSSFLEKARKN